MHCSIKIHILYYLNKNDNNIGNLFKVARILIQEAFFFLSMIVTIFEDIQIQV